MQEVDVAALVNGIIYLVPMAGLMVSIWTFTNANKERQAKNAADAAELKASIRHLTTDVLQMKDRYEKAADGYHKVDNRITELEVKASHLEKKMAELERRLVRD